LPNKAKIIYIITKSNWGGAQKYVFDMATEVAKEGYDVEVFFGGNGILADKLALAGIKTTSLQKLGRDVSLLRDIKVLIELTRLLRQHRPDIIHLNSSKIGAIGALAGRIAGVKKIIFTAHGWAFNEERSAPSKSILKFIYWIAIMLSHKTITVSEAMRARVAQWPFVGGKLASVHNGITPLAYLSKADAREFLCALVPALQERQKAKWVGSLAELHPIKNLDVAIRAIAELKEQGRDIIYLVFGEGEQRAVLEKLIADLGLQNDVFLLGHVDLGAQYLHALDIFMLVSRSEGLAYAILEAGMAKMPVIATAVGGIPEIITDMQSGILVQPNKPSEIAHAITYYIENHDREMEFKNTLHKKVADEFSVKKMLERTVVFYA
jgi:glycosyltransferase involved in cell wall biosynthesis